MASRSLGCQQQGCGWNWNFPLVRWLHQTPLRDETQAALEASAVITAQQSRPSGPNSLESKGSRKQNRVLNLSSDW